MTKIYVFGASGSGVSTLGEALAAQIKLPWFDNDTFYWKESDIPFTDANPPEVRASLLKDAVSHLESWVLSGSCCGWGDDVTKYADYAVFLSAGPDIRVERVKQRESGRFGLRIMPGGDMHEEHVKFVEWVAQYDDGSLGGRSRAKHEDWMSCFENKIIRLNSEVGVESLISEVVTFL